jgi:hypothetical protein
VQVLFFFFSRNDPARASAYFRIIEKEAEAAGTVVEPALAEMYLSHMLQLDDPTEALSTLRRLELKHSMQTNRSVLIDHPADRQEGSGAALSGGKLKVGALLYAKVVNVLLRANRTEDAEALIPVLEAKNLTRKCRTLNLVDNFYLTYPFHSFHESNLIPLISCLQSDRVTSIFSCPRRCGWGALEEP